MPEPLKFRKVWVTLENPDEQDIITWFEAVVSFRKDIKSAVQGLLDEIKIEKERYKEIKEVVSGLCIAEEKIKKWLPDAVSEDG